VLLDPQGTPASGQGGGQPIPGFWAFPIKDHRAVSFALSDGMSFRNINGFFFGRAGDLHFFQA
jgi:hypothetical protein